jgi:hypothetical protein
VYVENGEIQNKRNNGAYSLEAFCCEAIQNGVTKAAKVSRILGWMYASEPCHSVIYS